MNHDQPSILCTDLEGVFVPEIWIAVAETTQIEQLRLTTRDVSDYDALMQMRMQTLRRNDLRLRDVQAVIGGLSPLPGAIEFVNWIRAHTQLVILSDTFYEFATPLMAQMGYPTIFCHSLQVDDEGFICGWRLRVDKPKRRSVLALKELGFRTLAMGDSYNDIAMLSVADVGLLFAPPDNVVAEHPQFPVTRTYDDARSFVESKFLSS